MHVKLLWVLSATLLLGTSCNSNPDKFEVHGKVTIDNTPIEAGDIFFAPEDASRGTEAGKIQNGTYRLLAHKGKNKVQIRATRVVPGKFGPMGEPLLENIIPAKYASETPLTADVAADKTTFDFPLSGK